MVAYRCYILDAENHILQAHDLDCETDAAAAAAAKLLLARDPYHRAAELWKGTQRVLKLEQDSAIVAGPPPDSLVSAGSLGPVA